MDREQLAPRANEISRVLGDVKEDAILDELDSLVNRYGVGVEDAVASIRRKYTGSYAGPSSAGPVKVAEVRGDEQSVDLLVRVVSVEERTIGDVGNERTILTGDFGDETGVIRFTVWEPAMVDLSQGDAVMVRNAYAKVYMDRPQVNLGNRASIERRERSEVEMPSVPKSGLMKVADVEGDEQSVDLLVRVVSVEERTIGDIGNERTILTGDFGDETGVIRFTVWEPAMVTLERGDAVMVRNAYAKVWREQPQVNLGNRASVERRERSEVEMPDAMMACGVIDMASLREGMGTVAVRGRPLFVEERTINLKDGPTTVQSGVLSDGTGKVQFTAWDGVRIEKGRGVMIENAYIRAYRGVPQLNIGERSVISDAEGLPPLSELEKPMIRRIGDIEDAGGGVDVTVQGTVVDIKDGSGLILRCPECNRMVKKGECQIHGRVEGRPDLRLKAVVDDGSGAITTILNRDITERLTGIELNEAETMARNAMNMEVVQERMEAKLITRTLRVTGNATSDDYGMMFIAWGAELVTQDVRSEIEGLVADLEGSG